ncbi:MAG: hypothetical protein ACOC56_00410 [Atribacterota bacterium]
MNQQINKSVMESKNKGLFLTLLKESKTALVLKGVYWRNGFYFDLKPSSNFLDIYFKKSERRF